MICVLYNILFGDSDLMLEVGRARACVCVCVCVSPPVPKAIHTPYPTDFEKSSLPDCFHQLSSVQQQGGVACSDDYAQRS